MTRRRCERVDKAWLGRLDGTWTSDEASAFEAHVAACASCRADVAADRRVLARLAEQKSVFAVSPTSQRFLDHLATRVMADVRSTPVRAEFGFRVAWRRLVFVGAAAVAGVFLLFAAMSVRQQQSVEGDGRVDLASNTRLEGVFGALGELDSEDLPEVEAMAATGAGQAFELSTMNREEIKLLDEELHLDLPADFAQIEAAMVAGLGGEAQPEAQLDEALDDLTDAELRDIGDQIGREIGPAARERRGG